MSDALRFEPGSFTSSNNNKGLGEILTMGEFKAVREGDVRYVLVDPEVLLRHGQNSKERQLILDIIRQEISTLQSSLTFIDQRSGTSDNSEPAQRIRALQVIYDTLLNLPRE